MGRCGDTMADDRTTEQREADEQLREAVRAVAHAYADDETGGWVVTEYVLVYSQQGWDDEGDQCTAVGTAVEGDATPIHRLLGLVEYAATRYRRLVAEGDDY